MGGIVSTSYAARLFISLEPDGFHVKFGCRCGCDDPGVMMHAVFAELSEAEAFIEGIEDRQRQTESPQAPTDH